MTNHTPAPWAIRYTDNGLRVVFSDGELRSHVADLNSMSLCEEHGDLRANASLIASAPDLLSALEWAVSQIEDDLCPDHQAALAGCRSAIAKAKGEA